MTLQEDVQAYKRVIELTNDLMLVWRFLQKHEQYAKIHEIAQLIGSITNDDLSKAATKYVSSKLIEEM